MRLVSAASASSFRWQTTGAPLERGRPDLSPTCRWVHSAASQVGAALCRSASASQGGHYTAEAFATARAGSHQCRLISRKTLCVQWVEGSLNISDMTVLDFYRDPRVRLLFKANAC